eukprot:gnl/TRDRNA2_/TRDRNA2_195756_c0_seq1.p1 gnl/TRDRNA2_/TRDRNA2_195756_c0~~gnl/TRDRNA2_/TRDRNA2_195756_c0_seq1.p1  ORF type:complete len:142 (+),score=18.98 gnl/TRDRNA2_/TRDRNA2_195756_c0_seq1:117-542(+)
MPPADQATSRKIPEPLVRELLAWLATTVWWKLLACMLVDLAGCFTYIIPIVGELGDLAWAPIQFYFLNKQFGTVRMAGFGFLEELGPGTDFFPTATFCWVLENTNILDPLSKQLRILTGIKRREAVAQGAAGGGGERTRDD